MELILLALVLWYVGDLIQKMSVAFDSLTEYLVGKEMDKITGGKLFPKEYDDDCE